MMLYWSNYRVAWMTAVNAVVNTQKLILAQTKWLLSQAPSARVIPLARGTAGNDVGRPTLAAQATGEHRVEQSPRAPRQPPSTRAKLRGKRRTAAKNKSSRRKR
jgi:hypothetical protein